jgi:hypothetical protein
MGETSGARTRARCLPWRTALDIPAWLWFVTIGGLLAVIAADLLVVNRNPHAVQQDHLTVIIAARCTPRPGWRCG